MIALVLAMVWVRRGQAVTLALLTLFGVAAAVAAPAYLRAADRAVAAGQVGTSRAEERSLSLIARQHDRRPGRTRADLTAHDVALGDTGSSLVSLPGFDYTYAAEFPTTGLDPDNRYRTRLVYRQQACRHLTVTAGRCLIGESDVVLGEQTAKRLKIGPGDEIRLRYSFFNRKTNEWIADGAAKRLLVSGVYRATDPGEAYWGAHNYFGADTGARAGEPAFVTNATLTGMDRGDVDQSIDGSAPATALSVDRLPAVRDGLARLNAQVARLGGGISVDTRMPDLLARIDAGRAAAHRIVPVLAVSLVLLACLTIYLAVGYGTEGRRPELAVVALRGARWGQRWWLATGENLVAILAGAVLGCLAGQVLVDLFAAWRFPGVGADPGLEALRWAPAAAAAAVVTALLAERRQLGRPVAELLRRVPPAPRAAGAIAAEAVVVLLAAVAVAQLAVTGGGLTGVGTFAAALVLVAAALVAARVILPWSTVLARRQLRVGRLATALAAFQVSRRPGGARLFALLTAAIAVVGYAAGAVDVGARGREVQAGVGIGAARVVSVGSVSRQGLLAAVRAADPAGAYAMAAVRLPAERGRPPVLAIDTARAAKVAEWGGYDPARVAPVLRPPAGRPVPLRGGRFTFDITAGKLTVGKGVLATVVLSPAGGPADESVGLGELIAGRHSYTADVPACAAGCAVKSLQLAGRAGSLDLTGVITLHAVRAAAGTAAGDVAPAGLPAGALAAADGWRATEGGRLTAGPDGLRVEITSLNGITDGLFVQPADAPRPLPVATAGPVVVSAVRGLDGRALTVTEALRVPAVPGLGTGAVLADLEYADRLATDAAPTVQGQVWLSADAPADAVGRLRAAGLVVTSDIRAAQVRAQLDRQGPALALWFYVIVAVLAVALAAGALVLAATVDRSRRVEDLTALRGQGLTRAAVRRATLWTYPVLVGAAVVAGTAIALLGWRLTGWALPLAGLDPPALPLPELPRPLSLLGAAVASFVVLSAVAVLAGRRTLRSIR
ncbi:FtsX-like permease family protein [Actinoplanes sp. CA-030573]|uniref:FtsX-like permease family protein n=1 Tax=Actinoplanes sp. CA-030573 TaxID=3239898 RepID=UPI003D913EB7